MGGGFTNTLASSLALGVSVKLYVADKLGMVRA